MLENYVTTVKHITKDFTEKQLKKYGIKSLINLHDKLLDKENALIQESMLNLKPILESIVDGIPKQNRVYRKEFGNLTKLVVDEYGYHRTGSITEKYTGLGLVFGVAVGAAFTSFVPSASALGLVLGMTIGTAIGSNKEKVEKVAGNLY